MRSMPQVAPDCVTVASYAWSCSTYATLGLCCSAFSWPALSVAAKPFTAAVYTNLGLTPATAATERGSAPSFSTTTYEPSIAPAPAESRGAASGARPDTGDWSEHAASASVAPTATTVLLSFMASSQRGGVVRAAPSGAARGRGAQGVRAPPCTAGGWASPWGCP